MSKTLHLMTQRDQPMGSERRCCENCGLMMVGRDAAFWSEHAWTVEPANYKDGPAEGEDFTTCDTARKPKTLETMAAEAALEQDPELSDSTSPAVAAAIAQVEACLRHFTRTPSTLADSTMRGQTHEAIRTLRAALPAAPSQESVTIDFKQATDLLAMFGGEPTEIALMTGDGHSGPGLYAVYNADPEGSVFLGQTDEEATPAEHAITAADVVAWLRANTNEYGAASRVEARFLTPATTAEAAS